jgi:hypothetical protein
LLSRSAVAAPGGNILSTWPVALGSYTVISGTSMAVSGSAASSLCPSLEVDLLSCLRRQCPFISGVAALMLSVNGKLDPLTVRYLLETTSVPYVCVSFLLCCFLWPPWLTTSSFLLRPKHRYYRQGFSSQHRRPARWRTRRCFRRRQLQGARLPRRGPS